MRPVFTSNARAFLLSVAAATLLTTSSYADCTYELFNIASVKGTSVGDFIDQISDECGMSVIVTDEEAENILKKQMNKTYLKNLTINEVLDLIIKENNLQYTLQNNVLKIAYLTTKTYQIDYISGERKGEGSTNIRLSSNTGTSAGSAGGASGAATGAASGSGGAGGSSTNASSESGTNISSKDEVKFWSDLDNEIKSILNRPEDSYRQNNALDQNSSDVHHIYINKSAGLVTVSATSKQLQRLDKYIADLQKKMQTQVMIDVKIYSVTFEDGSSTGIDWSQLYALQNIDMTFDYQNTNKVTTYSSTALNTGTAFSSFPLTDGNNVGSIFRLGAKGSLKEVIKFLKTQGDVHAVSNPKILTLNNQAALITSGTELFYKTKNSSTLAGGSTGTTTQDEVVSSVFAGVLLDITPEIASDGSITLRINPSISDVASQLATDNSARSMPPDLSRRQMSSVVTVQDGNTVIMGGLIGTKNDMSGNKVPLLGDIPGVGWLFKSEKVTKKTEEMVIIIQPHIVKKDGSNMNLSDLGYSRMGSSIAKDDIAHKAMVKQSDEEVKRLEELTKNSK